jgi:hypothetical protein
MPHKIYMHANEATIMNMSTPNSSSKFRPERMHLVRAKRLFLALQGTHVLFSRCSEGGKPSHALELTDLLG